MVTYKALQSNRRQFLALTGLTISEFQRLLTAFSQAYQQHYSANQTAKGRPRQRAVGGGCKGRLEQPEDKLLFLLVYLKTYPLQAVMAELFGLSTTRVNCWIHRLLPVLRSALDDLGVLPERDPTHFAQAQGASGEAPRLIIDATERRRQRPKTPEKQALFYSGRKKKHCDKNVVIVNTRGKRIDYLGRTYPGKTHDKKMADEERISYPPGATLHQDTGFQGYEPAVKKTCQAKKKATPRRTHGGREAN
jgi:DDE superfamily endonuclease